MSNISYHMNNMRRREVSKPKDISTVEPWRFEKNHRKNPNESKENREAEPVLPERLYRQTNLGDLFLLWRDNELPLQEFKGSPHSDVDSNSVGNFWFTQPVFLDSHAVNWQLDGYIVTEPKHWKNPAILVQESTMKYKPNDRSIQELRTIPEVHTANRLSLSELTVLATSVQHQKFKKFAELLQTWGEPAETYDNHPFAKQLRKDDEAWLLALQQQAGKISFREFGESDAESRPDSLANFPPSDKRLFELGRLVLDNAKKFQEFKQFCEWLANLPVIPTDSLPADMEKIYNNNRAQKKNEKRFLEFYNSISVNKEL